MTVPYTFGTATTSIPLSNLDANFNTPITLGNTSIYLGNTTTTIGNLTLTNATISSGNIANITITNVSVTTANVTNITVTGTANIATGNVTTLTSTSITDSGLTSGRVTFAGANGLLTDSANLKFDGNNLGIGTTPAYDLQVSKTVSSGSVITQINNPSATGSARLYLGNDAGESSAYFQVFGSSHAAKPSIINIGGNANYPLVFDTNGTEKMRITSAGLVGIGTSSPTTQIEVKSVAFTDSEITLDNTSSNTTSRVLFKAAGTEYGRVSGDSTSVILQSGNIPIVFRTNSAERMRLDSAGNLGLGVTPSASNASTSFEMANGSTLFARTVAPQFGLMVNSVGNWYEATYKTTAPANMYLLAGGQHQWYNAPSGTAGNTISYTQAMTLNPNNGLQLLNTIGVGNATPSTSGAGVTFPATQSASSDANTLDDYEEGTWTPAISGDGTTFAGTSYLGRAGKYVKVGDVVWVSFDVEINGTGTQANNASISGLPFAIPNSGDLSNGGGGLTYMNNMQTNYVYQSCYPQNNSSYLFMIGRTAASTSTATVAATSFFANAGRIVGWAWYRTTV